MASTQNGYQNPSEDKDTEFRRLFKKYKSRKDELDLDNVTDLRVSDVNRGLVCVPANTEIGLDVNDVGIELRPIKEWSITTLSHRPGLYVLNNIITPEAQLHLMEKCLLQYPEPPNVTNFHIDGSYFGKDVFINRADKLRWVTMGNDYDWTNKIYAEQPREPLPRELVRLADIVSRVLGLGEMKADAVIANFYPPKATLSAHVDKSERSIERPLISISLGQSAIYLTGGTSLDDSVDPLLLHSGDILVMHQDQRLVYHAVPRILKTRSFDQSKSSPVHPKVLDYANRCRVNITIRQVD